MPEHLHYDMYVSPPHELTADTHPPVPAQPPPVADTTTLAAGTATGDYTAAYGTEITHQCRMHEHLHHDM
jgi:hypothetical protein